MSRYDVFLSHASADKPEVEQLARKLRDQGLEPFLDKWHLIPGERWQEALEDALDQSRTCAVFLGKAFGPWQNEEMRSALETCVRDAGFRVIPVLLPGGREPGQENLPRFLRRLTWVDFRRGLEDEEAFRRLLAGIWGEAPGPGSDKGGSATLSLSYRCMAPAREPFVQRGEYAKVRDALLVPRESAEDSGRPTTVGITTAIHGAGGFGKTALAIELCYDERVREHYPGGILWTTMGEEIDDTGRLARVRDLIRWWKDEDPPAFETVLAASAHLRKQLEGKRVLLVVDDVWRPADVTPFQGLGPKATLLLTTRDSRTLPSKSVPIHVDAMEVPEAVRLLASGLPDGTGIDLRQLATRLGEWPLLLKIVNRQLRELVQGDGLSLEQSFQEVNEALDIEGLTVFDREDLEFRDQAVARTVGASLRRLSGEDASRFEQLAIFPEDQDIPLRVLAKLWNLGPVATKKICGRLHDLSLLLRFDRQVGTIRLHDVIRGYLLKKGESNLAEWHRHFLDTYLPANGRWPDLPREERYLWNHLIYHLMWAGQVNVCRNLLLDFKYLRSKLEAADINTLLADYSFLEGKDAELRIVRDALRLSSFVLGRNLAELPGQLLGRLLDREEAGICCLLQTIEGSGTPWLRPRKASLSRPGGALVRIIDHPGQPSALAVLPNGQLVSGSSEGTLRVWDVESGQTLQTLKGHSQGINSVLALDSHRVVSGSRDGMLRVWDIVRGKSLKVIEEGRSIEVMAALDSHRVIVFSPSSSDWAANATLRVWNVETGRALKVLKGNFYCSGMAVLDHCRVAMVFSRPSMIWIWDVDIESAQIFEADFDCHTNMAVLDGHRIVFGAGNCLRILDVDKVDRGVTLGSLEGYDNRAKAVAVVDSSKVVSGSLDGTLQLWDVNSGQNLEILRGHSAPIESVAVLNDRVVTSSQDGTMRVWDLNSRQNPRSLEGHSEEVGALAVLESHHVISCSNDGTLKLWDVECGTMVKSLKESATAVAVLDRHRVIVGTPHGLSIWDVENGQRLQKLYYSSNDSYRASEGLNRSGVSAVTALDNRRVVSGHNNGVLVVWDIDTGQKLQILKGHSRRYDREEPLYRDDVSAVAALDSRRVVSAGQRDEVLRVWDVEIEQPLQEVKSQFSTRVLEVLDGRWVICGSQTLRMWDLQSGQELSVFEGHCGKVEAVAVLNNRLVSCSRDQTLRMWDLKSGKVVCLFRLDTPVTAVAVIPSSRIIVAGDAFGGLHFFDLVEI